jgi:solute carrier family 25 protein 39/40
MAIPSNVIYFAGYDWLRTNPASPFYGRISDVTAPLVAGSVARVFSAAAIGPLEMLRTRMQAAQSSQKNVLRDTVRDMRVMVSEQGVTSMWRGLTLTLWRDVPFSALYWWGYEFIRKRLDESRARQSPSQSGEPLSHAALMMDSFLAGATAGAVSAFVTTPFDVGKTRQQTVMDKLTQEQRRNTPEGKSMPRFIWHIYTTEGTAGLFKGWTARCLKIAPGCAIMISSYEIGKKMAQKKVPDNE